MNAGFVHESAAEMGGIGNYENACEVGDDEEEAGADDYAAGNASFPLPERGGSDEKK